MSQVPLIRVMCTSTLLSANVGSIVVNPWWTLPPTVLREGKRYSPARGYVYQTIGGKTYVRQKPGPMNALGRVKINMPNPYAIYLHDTPSKWAFARTDRALSHGCIRVKDIAALAEKIGDAEAKAHKPCSERHQPAAYQSRETAAGVRGRNRSFSTRNLVNQRLNFVGRSFVAQKV